MQLNNEFDTRKIKFVVFKLQKNHFYDLQTLILRFYTGYMPMIVEI